MGGRLPCRALAHREERGDAEDPRVTGNPLRYPRPAPAPPDPSTSEPAPVERALPVTVGTDRFDHWHSGCARDSAVGSRHFTSARRDRPVRPQICSFKRRKLVDTERLRNLKATRLIKRKQCVLFAEGFHVQFLLLVPCRSLESIKGEPLSTCNP